MGKFMPIDPGHYWYLPVDGTVDDWVVLKVTRFEERDPWTSIDGIGEKVSELEGCWSKDRLEDSRENKSEEQKKN